MSAPDLALNDIQSGVLRPRPSPYAATYLVVRIDDPKAGRELVRRLTGVVSSAAQTTSAAKADTWVSVSLTYRGLEALGVPQDSLDSFAWEFKQGMAARAKALGDVGESAPEQWEAPLGTNDVHLIVTGLAPDQAALDAAVGRARAALAARRRSRRRRARHCSRARRPPPAAGPRPDPSSP